MLGPDAARRLQIHPQLFTSAIQTIGSRFTFKP